MTGDLSKNRLVKLGYDPRVVTKDRDRFFADKAIRQLSLNGAISSLKLLIFEVKSLEKEYPSILMKMGADLDRLESVSAMMRITATANASTKRKKRKKPEKLPPHLLDRPEKGKIRLTTGQQ